jgi:hypothetical protein
MCKENNESAKLERKMLTDLARQYPERFRVQELKPEDGFDRYDAIMIREEMEIVEVKVRKIGVNDFPTAYLECDKVAAMIEVGREYPTFPLMYYAFYPEDFTLLIWNVCSPHSIERNVMAPKTSDWDNTMVLKDMCCYPIADAIRVDLNDWGF